MEDSVQQMASWGGEYFSRLSWFRSEVVSRARVMVVGCGALGNEVLKNLVLFGVQHIVLVDFDRVERSNLTRSVLFREEDAEKSRSKVEVAAERLRDINPRVEIEAICGDVGYDVGLGLMREMSVVISCLDSRYARYMLCRLAFRGGVDWVDGGIDGLEGTVRVFRYGENCYACNLGERGLEELSRRMSCSDIARHNEANDRVATTPVIASIIGGVEVQEAMKLLHREELERGELTSLCGKMLYWEGEHLSSKIVEFKRYDDDCPLHDRWDEIEESELSAEMLVEEFILEVERRYSIHDARIVLCNRTFVEHIELHDYVAMSGAEGRQWRVMMASFRVAEFVANDEFLSTLPQGAIYQREHREVGREEIFRGLRLLDVGIPRWDVVKIRSREGVRYIELGGDRLWR